MKKFVAGLLVGALLMVSFTAYGASESLIGKQIQRMTKVLLNGEDVGEAIVIEGKSYAPVRSISEAVGLEVDFVDGEVILSSVDQGDVVPMEELSIDKINVMQQQLRPLIVIYKKMIDNEFYSEEEKEEARKLLIEAEEELEMLDNSRKELESSE